MSLFFVYEHFVFFFSKHTWKRTNPHFVHSELLHLSKELMRHQSIHTTRTSSQKGITHFIEGPFEATENSRPANSWPHGSIQFPILPPNMSSQIEEICAKVTKTLETVYFQSFLPLVYVLEWLQISVRR